MRVMEFNSAPIDFGGSLFAGSATNSAFTIGISNNSISDSPKPNQTTGLKKLFQQLISAQQSQPLVKNEGATQQIAAQIGSGLNFLA